jgi:8-oxo-dGTP pyrophosphatase MutT (NUDIX family)
VRLRPTPRPYSVTRDAEPDRGRRGCHRRIQGAGRTTATAAPGETEPEALARELAEELGIEVVVCDRLGDDIALNATTTLRAYQVNLIRGEPHPHDHGALRWVTAAQLHEVDWVPADRDWLPALARML